MKNIVFSLALLLTVWACGPAEKKAEAAVEQATGTEASVEQAEKAVFAVHDEAMPRIDEVMKLKKALNGQLVALDSVAATANPTQALRADEQKAQVRQLVTRLTEADSLMMDWMANYNGDTLKKIPQAEAIRYLNDQKQRITDAKNKIDQSISQANAYLQP